MTLWLPITSAFLAVLSLFAFRDGRTTAFKVDKPRTLVLILLALCSAFIAVRFGPAVDHQGLICGLVIGCLVTWIGAIVGGQTTPLAIGVAGASALHLLPQTSQPAAQIALLVGLGIGSLALVADGALTVSLMATLAILGDKLGTARQEPAATFLGSELAIAIVVGALLAGRLPRKLTVLQPVVVGVVAIVAALTAVRSLDEGSLAIATGIGALAGVFIHWLLPDDSADGLRVGLGAIIGIGVATIAFGFGRGVGMALALTAAGGVLLAVGNGRALMTLGPLFGLVFYRVLREQGTGATRALDIGQHYTLLTLILGMVFPLLPCDWLKRTGRRGDVGAFLWGALCLAIPPLVILLFGSRGGVGFVVGLGLTGLFQVIRREKSLLALSLGIGMAGSTLLSLTWLAKVDELTRDEKVRLIAISGAAILVVAAGLAFLSKPEATEVKA